MRTVQVLISGRIQHVGADNRPRIAAGDIEDHAALPVLDEPRDPSGALRQKQPSGSDGQIKRTVGADVMSNCLVWRSVVGIPVQRIGPILRDDAQCLGKNVGALKTDALRRPDRDLRLHRVEVGFAEAPDVSGSAQLRICDDVVFRETSGRDVGG